MKDALEEMIGVTRLEVISKEGRELVHYLKDNEVFNTSYQDQGRTVKIFIDTKEVKDEV